MSLLGPHVPVTGWTAAPAVAIPDCDTLQLHIVGTVAVRLLHRGGSLHPLGQELAAARDHFAARLLEGRVEAAEVRYALGLPMSATRGEGIAAIRVRA